MIGMGDTEETSLLTLVVPATGAFGVCAGASVDERKRWVGIDVRGAATGLQFVDGRD